MKKIVFASLLALGTSTLLAGCGLIPAQTIKNPLGLDGVQLSSSVLSATSAPISNRITTPVAGTGTVQTSASFDDVDLSALLIDPASINLASEVTGATATPDGCAANGTYKVNLTDFKIDVTDNPGTLRKATANVDSFNFDIVIAGGKVTSNTTPTLTGSVTVSDISVLIAILKKATPSTSTKNTVSVNGKITTTPAMSGCTIAFSFKNGTGTIGF